MKKNTPTSDPIYKRLYSFAEMVADLLRSILPAEMLAAVDLRSLEKVSAEYVGDDSASAAATRCGASARQAPTAAGRTCWCCSNSRRAATRRWRCG